MTDSEIRFIVTKKDGTQHPFDVNKVYHRINAVTFGLNMEFIDVDMLSRLVFAAKHPQMTGDQVDTLIAQTVANFTSHHQDYALLAGRIETTRLNKHTASLFSVVTQKLSEEHLDLLNAEYVADVRENADALDAAVVHDRDYSLNISSYKTLEGIYLLNANGRVLERPQHLWMRVAVAIHRRNLLRILETYDLLSKGLAIHASPTLFNAGKKLQQLSTCFLRDVETDSFRGTFECVKQSALISQHARDFGLSLGGVTPRSMVVAPNSLSGGLLPLLRVFDATAGYATQAGGKRPGAMTAYLPVWHAEIVEFIRVKDVWNQPSMRAQNLHTAIWVPDLFMQRVDSGDTWSLFEPADVPDLLTTFGIEFDFAYQRYETRSVPRRVISAKELMSIICQSQIETGTPFMLYQDNISKESNQASVRPISCSNSSTESTQFTAQNEIAVCTLASVVLPAFVAQDSSFSHAMLRLAIRILVRNLDTIIDKTAYPTNSSGLSGRLHRALGLGVEGLADVFIRMKLPFDSAGARALNRSIFETIYFSAVEMSCDLAWELGPYSTSEGSPLWSDKFQFDFWGVNPSDRWDWTSLRQRVRLHGVRNSLLVAAMPTTSTRLTNTVNDGFEPYTSKRYIRRTLSGEFQMACRCFVEDLIEAGLWTPETRQAIIAAHGSIEEIRSIPNVIRARYKTVWEIDPSLLMTMAAENGPFICQSQPMPISTTHPTQACMETLHFHAWKQGVKTSMYNLQPRAARHPTSLAPSQLKLRSSCYTDTGCITDNAGDGPCSARWA